MRNIVILGNGIAGTTVAREVRKRSDDKITLISSETRHFYSRPALMYIYMGHMKFEHTKPYEDWFWEKNRIDLVFDGVESVDFTARTLKMRDGTPIAYDVLVLATGAKSNFPDIPGRALAGVQGLYGYPDLQSMEENTRGISKAVVAGGGLIGVEMAEMLRSRGIEVSFLVREKSYWNNVLPEQEGRLLERHIRKHAVDLRLATEVREILGDTSGRARAVMTKSGEEIPCQFVGLAVGVSPNIAFLKGGDLETDRGILVDDCFGTNIPGVHAIGDCAQFRIPPPDRRSVEQVWYTGKMQAEFLARNLCGEKHPYTPGIWFNSAKFFDIEYQTYGSVLAVCPPGEDSFYWEHPKDGKSMRIQFRRVDQAVLGFNFFGVRARHQICERWIAAGKPLSFVVENLRDLNFDPEFFRPFHKSVQERFRSIHA